MSREFNYNVDWDKDYNPIAVKHESDKDGISVLVSDENNNYPSVWLDCYINSDHELIIDWNKYIFYLTDEKDLIIREFQNNPDNLNLASDTVYYYLLDNNLIIEHLNHEYDFI